MSGYKSYKIVESHHSHFKVLEDGGTEEIKFILLGDRGWFRGLQCLGAFQTHKEAERQIKRYVDQPVYHRTWWYTEKGFEDNGW